jgi:acetoin utilization protein AcuB
VRHDRIDPGVPDATTPETPPPLVVADRMRRPVVTIRRDETLDAAWGLLQRRKVRHLPVVDDEGRLVGIVTDRDLRHALIDPRLRRRARHLLAPTLATAASLAATARSLAALPVEQVMTRGALAVSPATTLREAALLMHERRVGAVPVVEAGGRVVGMLSEVDVVRALLDGLAERASARELRWLLLGSRPDPAHGRRRDERLAG